MSPWANSTRDLAQKGIEVFGEHMRQPVGEKDEIVLLPRLPLKQIGLLVRDASISQLLLRKSEHLRSCINSCDVVGHGKQDVRPGPCSTRQFQHLFAWT